MVFFQACIKPREVVSVICLAFLAQEIDASLLLASWSGERDPPMWLVPGGCRFVGPSLLSMCSDSQGSTSTQCSEMASQPASYVAHSSGLPSLHLVQQSSGASYSRGYLAPASVLSSPFSPHTYICPPPWAPLARGWAGPHVPISLASLTFVLPGGDSEEAQDVYCGICPAWRRAPVHCGCVREAAGSGAGTASSAARETTRRSLCSLGRLI